MLGKGSSISLKSAELSYVLRSSGFVEVQLRGSSVPAWSSADLLLRKGIFHVLRHGCSSFLQMVRKACLVESGTWC